MLIALLAVLGVDLIVIVAVLRLARDFASSRPRGAQSRSTFWLRAVATRQEEPMTVSAETLRSVSTPERVETRLGTLEFDDGAPSEQTAALVYDHLDFMNGVQAFLRGISDDDRALMRGPYREPARSVGRCYAIRAMSRAWGNARSLGSREPTGTMTRQGV